MNRPRTGGIISILLLALAAASAGEPVRHPVEARVETMLQRWVAGSLQRDWVAEPALRVVAREHSEVMLTGASVDTPEFIRQGLSERGLLDPFPFVFHGRASSRGLAELERRLVAALEGVAPGERALFTHVACGIAERKSRFPFLAPSQYAVTVLVSQRAISFAPFPADLRPGDRLRFEGELHPPFREPEVLLTRPDGSTVTLDNLTYEARLFRTYVVFDRGPGEYQLEVLGRYDFGPRVLGLASLHARAEGEPSAHARLVAAARNGVAPRVATAAPRQEPPASVDDCEARLLQLMNRDRRAAGVAPLAWHPGLAAVARAHSCDMRDHDFFAHVSPRSGRLAERAASAHLPYARLAENIAVNENVDSAHEALMRSPGHRMNVLDGRFTYVGLGVAFATSAGSGTRVFVTQNFLCPPGEPEP